MIKNCLAVRGVLYVVLFQYALSMSTSTSVIDETPITEEHFVELVRRGVNEGTLVAKRLCSCATLQGEPCKRVVEGSGVCKDHVGKVPILATRPFKLVIVSCEKPDPVIKTRCVGTKTDGNQCLKNAHVGMDTCLMHQLSVRVSEADVTPIVKVKVTDIEPVVSGDQLCIARFKSNGLPCTHKRKTEHGYYCGVHKGLNK